MFRLLTVLFVITALSAVCPEDQYCLSCLNGRCQECIFSYLNEETGACVAADTIEFCSQYLNAETCDACVPNYYLSENKCIKIPIENCMVAEEVQVEDSMAVKCLICKDGLLVTENACSAENKCEINGCVDCERGEPTEENKEGEEFCAKCEVGKSVNPLDGDCVEEVTENCLELDKEELASCGSCKPGFFNAKDDTCVAVTEYSADAFSTTKTEVEQTEEQTEQQTEAETTATDDENKQTEEQDSDSEESEEDSAHILVYLTSLLMLFFYL